MSLKYKISKVVIIFFILIAATAVDFSGFFMLKSGYNTHASVLKNKNILIMGGNLKLQNKSPAVKLRRGFLKTMEDYDFHTIYYGSYGKSVLLSDYILSKLGYLPLNCIVKEKHKKIKFIWKWKYKNIPAEVKSEWKPGYFNTLLRGAVMNFQYEQKLIVTGLINKLLWKVLIKDYLKKTGINRWGIYYAIVDKNFPETVSIWRNGDIILTSLTNTGILESPTDDGVFPIYLRFFTANMSGITPWKTEYNDKDIPFVSYFDGGSALHGFPRGIYGINQSLGCVELSIIDSFVAWKKLSYGSLVVIKKYSGTKPVYNEKLRPKKFHLILKLKAKANFKSKKLKTINKEFKLFYVDHSYTYNGASLAYIRLFYVKNGTIKHKTILTTNINYASNIDFMSMGKSPTNSLIFFSDTKSLKGVFDRSIYCFTPDNPGNIQRVLTIRHQNEGILSNIAIGENKIWFVLYSYKKNKLKDYLCEYTFNLIKGKIKIRRLHKIKLNFYSPYLTLDNRGDLWISGLRAGGNEAVNYIKMLGSENIKTDKISRRDIKAIYSFKGHFYGTMPFIVEKNGAIFILKHSYHNNDFLNNLIEIRRGRKDKLSPGSKQPGRLILDISNFKGFTGNLVKSINGNIFFIKNYLKNGIFKKTLYEIYINKTNNKVRKVFSFYGNSNGVVNNILPVNK